jgi:hypothetical protein
MNGARIVCHPFRWLLSRPTMVLPDHPSRLKVSVTRHYKLADQTPGVKPSSLSSRPPSPGEISTPLALLVYLLSTLRSSTMKFSTVLVLYLSATIAPSALAVPLRYGDYCPPGGASVRCIGHSDDHAHPLNASFNGGNTSRESSDRQIPSVSSP